VNTFKQFFKEKIEQPKGYYQVETLVPSDNGPVPVKGKVLTNGEAPTRYVLMRFLMGKGYINNREQALSWMHKYHDNSNIKWVEYEPELNFGPDLPGLEKPETKPKQGTLFDPPDQTYRN
jgi:hypothetical protein